MLWGAVESFRFAATLSLPVLIITLGYLGHITHTEDSSSSYWGTANSWPQIPVRLSLLGGTGRLTVWGKGATVPNTMAL